MAAPESLPGFQYLGELASFPLRGLQKVVLADSGVEVCVVIADRDAAKIHAIGNTCPHKQGDLSIGDIEDSPEQGVCVKCPRHRKKMNGGLNIRVRVASIINVWHNHATIIQIVVLPLM